MTSIVINVLCALVGAGLMYLYLRGKDHDRIRQLANLRQRPGAVFGELLKEPFAVYVGTLYEACVRARQKLVDFPSQAATAVNEGINGYWAKTIKLLEAMNAEATTAALRKHNLSPDIPYELGDLKMPGDTVGMSS